MWCGFVDEVVEADQPRHVEHALVHLPALGAPRDLRHQLVEQPVGVREPAGAHLHPRAAAELAPFGVFKQRAL